MTPADPDDEARQRARIDLLIESYRRRADRRLLRRAKRLWRNAALHRQLTRLDAPPEREH